MDPSNYHYLPLNHQSDLITYKDALCGIQILFYGLHGSSKPSPLTDVNLQVQRHLWMNPTDDLKRSNLIKLLGVYLGA
jgi:hypothetical protein